jgi:hypothetical protein
MMYGQISIASAQKAILSQETLSLMLNQWRFKHIVLLPAIKVHPSTGSPQENYLLEDIQKLPF